MQAYQLKENILRDNTALIWLAGDWNLSDALTKKLAECRQGLMLFLRTWTWKLRFDPSFVVSARKSRKAGRTVAGELKKGHIGCCLTGLD